MCPRTLFPCVHACAHVCVCVRARRSSPPQAQLYLSWKKFALEKEELAAGARRRRLDGLLDMRIRHENQVIALDAERRRAVGAVAEAVDKVRHTHMSTHGHSTARRARTHDFRFMSTPHTLVY